MKKYILILSVAMAIFACKPTNPVNPSTQLPEGWQPLDTLLIKKYFVESASNITYKDNSGKTTVFDRILIDNHYINTFGNKYSEDPEAGDPETTDGYEEYTLTYFYASNDAGLEFTVCVKQRFKLDFMYDYKSGASTGRYYCELEKDSSKEHDYGWPKDPEAYKAYFTDTIQLKKNGVVTGELVAGKGLAWFTDNKGVKWTLQE